MPRRSTGGLGLGMGAGGSDGVDGPSPGSAGLGRAMTMKTGAQRASADNCKSIEGLILKSPSLFTYTLIFALSW
jgi:hypothetical protein